MLSLKKIARCSFIFFFLSINLTISCAQNISGVINTYTAVNSAAGSTITVASSAGFNINDHVLLI
ncbi:MAG: hypothetical protein LH473_12040, partial [Chitinophagales bacterium]|nr:hypothetical protein [Chitinophagales bacterium]